MHQLLVDFGNLVQDHLEGHYFYFLDFFYVEFKAGRQHHAVFELRVVNSNVGTKAYPEAALLIEQLGVRDQ